MPNGLPPGIAPGTPVTTFTEHVAQINASPAFFESLAQQPDEGPMHFGPYRT